MTEWKVRLTQKLEPLLRERDPRPKISAYDDMPYCIFRYSPKDEFAVRSEIALLRTRLEQAGKRVTVISLAECMASALDAAGLTVEDLAESEKEAGLDKAIETVNQVLSSVSPLDDVVIARMPADPDPLRDIVFIVRAGALFPVYRTSNLLEHMMRKVTVPGVLFYPGEMEGPAGLRFMGVLDAEHNYRPKIF